MELTARLWKNFKTQPEIWFFYGFLLTFTLTVRKVLWFFPLRGEFNEYSGVYLYLSDIFLGLTLVAWLITILYNKIDILSMHRNIFSRKTECSTPASYHENVSRLPRSKEMFHPSRNVPRGTFYGTSVEHFFCFWGGALPYLMLPLALFIWSFISLVWAENKIVAIFRSIKILEFYLLYVFVLVRFFFWDTNNNVSRETLLKKAFGLIMFIGLFQAIIGIIQFFLQHSIGLFWLKESLISQEITGVAKIIFNGETFIRAYGLFPHPNILGGFLVFSILISLLYRMMFSARLDSQSLVDARRVEQLIKIFLGIQLLALILTFSKSAILGLFLGSVWYAYKNVPSHKECSTWNILRDKRGTIVDFFRKKKRLLIVSGLIVFFSVFILKPDWNSLLVKSLNQRSVYVNVSRGTIWNNPILGIGSGQFVISMENMLFIKENWMLQPVHNIFLLVWSELGIIGLSALFLLLGFILKGMSHIRRNVPRPPRLAFAHRREAGGTILRDESGTSSELAKTFGAIFIGLLFIMLFDHYLWDIQQGSFLLWVMMGFLVGAGEKGNDLTK